MNEWLREASYEIYHSIIEHNPDPIVVFTVEGMVKEGNLKVADLFGYTQEEIGRMHYRELLVPEQAEKGERFFARVLQGITSEDQFDALQKNGQVLHLEVKAIPLTIQQKIVGIFCVAKDLTDLLIAKSSLSQMEEKFKAIFNSSVDAIDLIDLNGNLIDVNPGFEKLYGWSRDEIIGKRLPIIPAHLWAQASKVIARIMSGEQIRGFEVDAMRKDGSTVNVSLTLSPVKNSEGEIVALSGIARDISRQKLLETSLKESEERYRKLVEYLPTGVLVHREGTILYANPSAFHILREPSLLQKTFCSYIHPDEQEIFHRRVREVEKGKELPFIEIKMITKDGTEIFTELGGVLINYDGGTAILTLFRDISERKRTEQALHEREKQYRLLADNSRDVIQLVNLDGIVTYASPSHKAVLGYDPHVFVGEKVFFRPDGAVDAAFRQAFLEMTKTLKPFTCEIFRTHKEGYPVWLEVMCNPMVDENGDFHNMMLVGHNITERKEYQKNLEYLSTHDALTGLPNRRLFVERLEYVLKKAKRYNRMFAVMYMDLDDFKRVNDTLGHDAGDELLKQFSLKVQGHLRESDTLARQGGDEFIILLSDIQQVEDVAAVAERLLASLQEPWLINGQTVRTTSSIGIATYPQDAQTPENLLKHADIALYKAKQSGKNNLRGV